MKAFAVLILILLAGAGLVALALHQWRSDIYAKQDLEARLLEETTRFIQSGEPLRNTEEAHQQAMERVDEIDRQIIDLLLHKPFGLALTPDETRCLKNTRERLADNSGEARRTEDENLQKQLSGPLPRPVAPRKMTVTPTPEQTVADENARRAAEIARKYASPR